MSDIIIGTFKNAPIWVWPLFFVLIGIGVMAMRTRHSSIIPYFFYPLFGLSAANAIGDLVHVPTNWTVFAVGYLLGMCLAFRWQDGLILEKTGWRMTLKGERITILILMLVFLSNFANGVIAAVAPEMRAAIGFTIVFAAAIGVGSGSFMGRALRVVTLRRRAVAVD